MYTPNRRSVIAGAGGTLVAALAGCTGDDDDGDGDGDDDDGDDGGTGTDLADTYLSDNEANGYEGEATDETGSDEVTIEVGAGSGGTAFAPASVRVDSGTTVVWEWTGEGGAHNVIPDGDTDFEDFGEEDQTEEAGHTVETTFDEAGVALYVCVPHSAQGMYGAVIVE